MLPSQRSATGAERGWRAMAVDREPLSSRIISLFRVKPSRMMSRTFLFLAAGTVVAFWLLFIQLGPSPFFNGPMPSIPFFGGDDDIYDSGFGWGSGKPNWDARAERVKRSFLHAYHGYEQHAAPRDELLPLSNGSVDNFNGWGVTIVDSLDTMYMMGLQEEFKRGVRLTEKIKFKNEDKNVPFFETVIRYLGGYLSAYALSRDRTLLSRADELGAALLPAFNTSSGFPTFSVNPKTNQTSPNRGQGWLAEVASCMMEYKYLAKVTGKKEYYDVSENIMRRLYDANLTRYPDGLLPSLWSLESGEPISDQVTIGAMADSAYEYLLKGYLLTNQTETESLTTYLRTMRGVMDHLMYLSPTRSFVYVTDISSRSGAPSRRFEHLACFLPGLFALGVDQLPQSVFTPFSEPPKPDAAPSEYERHRWAALSLGIGCATMYADMPTGLGPDEVMIMTVSDRERVRLQQQRIKEAEAKKKGILFLDTRDASPDPEADPAPPILPNAKMGSGRRPLTTKTGINQTLEDIKLRWGNVIDAWRAGRYDGERNKYIDIKDDFVDDGETFGRMWRSGLDNVNTIGPVPGLRDPPLPYPDFTDLARDYRPKDASYKLRPETIESMFILWRTTKDEIWRERGWAAYKAIETQLKSRSGYFATKSVFMPNSPPVDSMPSFLLAETFKYLYLMFSDDSVIPLDKYVFNTEAHPFPVFEWTDYEKRKFNITS